MTTDLEKFVNEQSRIKYNIAKLLDEKIDIDESFLKDELHYFLKIGLGKVIR
jgi:hypothetical protein